MTVTTRGRPAHPLEGEARLSGQPVRGPHRHPCGGRQMPLEASLAHGADGSCTGSITTGGDMAEPKLHVPPRLVVSVGRRYRPILPGEAR